MPPGTVIARVEEMSAEQAQPPRKAPEGHPLVSVIMPAYNSEAYITVGVEAVVSQTLTDWELIVVDDGSEDPQALDAVLAPYGERIRLIRQLNAGVAAARNAGLRAARGRYVAFLDSDDGWEPDFLATQIGILEGDPSITLVYCDATMFGDPQAEGRRAMEFSPSRGEADLLGLVSLRCTVLTSAIAARRDALLAVGGFDERLVVSEDFDLWLRLLLRGYRITYHTRPLARRHLHPGSLSSDTVRMDRAGITILKKHAEAFGAVPGVQSLALASIRTLEGSIALSQAREALRDGDTDTARLELRQASRLLGGAKLRILCALLSVAPVQISKLLRMRLGKRAFTTLPD